MKRDFVNPDSIPYPPQCSGGRVHGIGFLDSGLHSGTSYSSDLILACLSVLSITDLHETNSDN